MNILSLKNISYETDGCLLLDGISLDIPRGSFVGLIGPNGSGKSTLLKTIYRVNRASRGSVYLGGEEMRRMTNKEIANKMAVVAQENAVNFDFSVMEVLLTGLYAKRSLLAADSRRDVEICEAALASVGMLDFKNRSFLSLSGGEKQKVLIAGAFARDPELIILDEPTNHLDVGYQFLILDIMKQRRDTTVFTSIHDMNMAMQYCDLLIALEGGRVYAAGTPRQVLTRENLRRLFHVDAQIDPVSGHIRYLGFVGDLGLPSQEQR